MEKYFNLYSNCKFTRNHKKGCLYDTNSGKLYDLDMKNTEIIAKVLSNKKVDINNEILNELVNMNLGNYVEAPVYHENSIVDYTVAFNTFNSSNKLDDVYIQVSNECNYHCKICERTNRIFSKTHCKLWPLAGKPVSVTTWEKFFCEISQLGARKLIFIGGNPFLKIDVMETMIKLAQKNEINEFVAYANVNHLSQEIIDLCIKYDICINIQLMDVEKQVYDNIHRLKNEGIKIKVSILNGWDYKMDTVDIVTLFSNLGIEDISLSELYTDNNKMDDFEKKIAGRVSDQKILILGLMNSCLYGKVYVSINGEVMPCPMLQTEKLGSLMEKSIADILKSEKYQNLITASRSKIEGCKDCVFRYNCSDCRAIEAQASGNLFGGSYCSELGDCDESR